MRPTINHAFFTDLCRYSRANFGYFAIAMALVTFITFKFKYFSSLCQNNVVNEKTILQLHTSAFGGLISRSLSTPFFTFAGCCDTRVRHAASHEVRSMTDIEHGCLGKCFFFYFGHWCVWCGFAFKCNAI